MSGTQGWWNLGSVTSSDGKPASCARRAPMTAWFLEASLEAGGYGPGAPVKRREQTMSAWPVSALAGFLEHSPTSSSWRLVRRTVSFLCCAPLTAFCRRVTGVVQVCRAADREGSGPDGGGWAWRGTRCPGRKGCISSRRPFQKGPSVFVFFFPFSVMPARESVPHSRQDT